MTVKVGDHRLQPFAIFIDAPQRNVAVAAQKAACRARTVAVVNRHPRGYATANITWVASEPTFFNLNTFYPVFMLYKRETCFCFIRWFVSFVSCFVARFDFRTRVTLVTIQPPAYEAYGHPAEKSTGKWSELGQRLYLVATAARLRVNRRSGVYVGDPP